MIYYSLQLVRHLSVIIYALRSWLGFHEYGPPSVAVCESAWLILQAHTF